MGLLNYQQAQPFAPPEGIALLPGISAAMWYPLHGDVLAYGEFGHPDLTLTGIVGTLWSANFGAATPDGATHYASAAVGSAVLEELFDLRDINGQEIILGCEIQTDGGLDASEGIIWWGSNSGGGGATGWGLQLNSAEQVALEFRGAGSSGATVQGIGSTAMSDADRYGVVVSILGTAIGEAAISVTQWKFGTGLLTQQQATGVNLQGTAGTEAPGINSTYALTLMARRSSSSYDRFLGATSGSNAQLNNVWGVRLPVPVPGLAEQCAATLGAAPREFPRVLRSS